LRKNSGPIATRPAHFQEDNGHFVDRKAWTDEEFTFARYVSAKVTFCLMFNTR
jgi:hypothetical protein